MIIDTWGFAKDAAGWGIAFDLATDVADSASAANRWLAQVTEATLTALDDLGRPWRVSFAGIAEPEATPFLAVWRPAEQTSTAYREMIIAAIRNETTPIHSVDIDLELNAYVRTDDSPTIPVRTWLRLPSQLRLWSPYAGADASLWLEFEHTLFAPIGPNYQDNTELLTLNRPLLASALARWSDALGPITERVGYARDY